ncbi:MAG: hypothetical protein HPY69_05655 [Armatimonadetes bacterium]|nr:hypothetical protein [Armatimonadota bacterium]
MRANLRANAGTQFRVLSADDAERIYLGALRVLVEVGVLIKEPEARVLLEAHGAQVNDELVRIPEGMVRQAVAAAPPRFTVHSRDPARSLHIEPNRVHYGPGPICPNFLDPIRLRPGHTSWRMPWRSPGPVTLWSTLISWSPWVPSVTRQEG